MVTDRNNKNPEHRIWREIVLFNILPKFVYRFLSVIHEYSLSSAYANNEDFLTETSFRMNESDWPSNLKAKNSQEISGKSNKQTTFYVKKKYLSPKKKRIRNKQHLLFNFQLNNIWDSKQVNGCYLWIQVMLCRIPLW